MKHQPQSQQLITTQVVWYSVLIFISVLFSVFGLLFDFLIPIALIIGVLFVAIVIYQPFWGFLLYVAMVYLRPADLFPILATLRVQLLLLGLLVVLWLLRDHVFSSNRFQLYRTDWAVLGFLAIMGMSVTTSIYIGESITQLTEYAKLCAFYLLATQIVKTIGQLKSLVFVIVGSISFVSLIQIYTYFTIGLTRATGLGGYGIHIGPLHLAGGRSIGALAENVHGIGGYSSGFLGNASELGLGVLMVFPFAYYLYNTVLSRIEKLFFVSALGLLSVSLIICGSRGAAVAAVAVIFMIFFKSQRKSVLIFVALIGILVSGFLVSDRYVERIASTAEYESDESANIRLTLWKAGLQMMVDRPFLGVGVGNFHIAYGGTYRDPDSPDLWWEPHNNFIQVGSEMGVLGLIAYIFLLITVFKENKRLRATYVKGQSNGSPIESYTHACDVSLLGLVVAGCFITSTYFPHILILALMTHSMTEITNNITYSSQLGITQDSGADSSCGGNKRASV